MQSDQIIARRYKSLLLMGIVLPVLLYPILSLLFLSPHQSIAYQFTCSRFMIWAVLAILFVYASQAEVQPFLLLAEKPKKLSFYLISIVLMYMLTIVAGYISAIPQLLRWRTEDNHVFLKYLAVMKQYPILLVFAAITAGFTEELIFRGYIISRLSLLVKGKILPVIISATMFSLIHISYHSLRELIFAFLIGIMFGFHYQRYQNIRVLILLHILIDLIALTVASGR